VERVKEILSSLEGRKVLVVGLARSGLAVAKVLAGLGADVTGTDRKESFDEQDQLEQIGVRLALGGDRVELVRDSDLIVLSPGVPLTAAIPEAARQERVPILGALELASRLIQLNQKLPILAVTGTNGKSTTAALSAHLLELSGRKVFLGGNIGRPLADLLLQEDRVDLAVVEVSSFQLEHLSGPEYFVPQAGIWLNLTPDHLDRHGSLSAYAAIKRRMFEGQSAHQTGVFFMDDPRLPGQIDKLACQVKGFGRKPERLTDGCVLISGNDLALLGSDLSWRLNSSRLAGDHNAENAAAAIVATIAMGISQASIQAGLDSYAGLPHRLEPVREIAGVRYINDSKGTNIDATAKSLTSFSEPVLLLAGGRGKGTNFSKLCPIVSQRVSYLILFGEEAQNLARDLSGCAEIHMVASMAEAVERANDLAGAGEVVLLSPACASFDMFSDYAHRGRVFTELVQNLEEPK